MNKAKNGIITKILIFILSLVIIFNIFVFSFQKSITKDFISNILSETDVSEIVIQSNEDLGTYIKIKDYFYQNMEKIGIEENVIKNEIITNYINELTNYLLTDIVYNYINNNQVVLNISDYAELSKIDVLLSNDQKEKLNNLLEEFNNKLSNQMDTIFNENNELKLVKFVNNININYLNIFIGVLFIIIVISAKNKMELFKSLGFMLLSITILLVMSIVLYNNIFSNQISKLENIGNSLIIFLNDFMTQIGKIWKTLLIASIVALLIYLIYKLILKSNKSV